MVLSEQKSKECLHINKGKNGEGFLVCKTCGIVFDENPTLMGSRPFYKPHVHLSEMKNDHSIEPVFLGKIGTGRERKINSRSSLYSRLSLRNDHYKFEYKDVLEIEIFHEARRLIFTLKMPKSLIPEVIKGTKFFYSQLQKGSKFRNAHYLTPVTLFFICLRKNIFLKKSQLFKFSALDLKLFNQCFLTILGHNKTLQDELRNENFRKNLILNYLSGFVYQAEAPENFLEISKEILYKYWKNLETHSNKTVTGVIFSLTKDVCYVKLPYEKIISLRNFTDSKMVNHLGISQSDIVRAKRRLTGIIIKKELRS